MSKAHKEYKELGKKGEELVAHSLEKAGFTIQAKNYTIKQGEIDIIAQKNELIVFVEVKLRRNPLFPLSDLIVASKQKKIIRAALWYINQQRATQEYIYRFDVAFVEPHHNDYKITYIENAFAPK
jgi:putative endonuclease